MVNGPVADVNAIAVDHHLYDNLCDRWHKRASDPQPYVRVYFRAFEEDYRALGFVPRKRVSAAELPAMADTGCQSCLMGIQMAERMGLNADDLIPVTMTTRAANEGWSAILGYRQSGHNARATTNRIHHQHIRSYRPVTGLWMISETFPTQPLQHRAHATTHNTAAIPRRPTDRVVAEEAVRGEHIQHMHPPNTAHDVGPTPATDDRQECDTPVTVHWQDEVKAGLDADVRPGMLEKVPVGDRITCCHRMVICAKKNGKPRCTLDFQALNVYAARDTHHTPSPFHQARGVPKNKRN